MNRVRLTFLGTGTSQGVPMIGCDCEVCRSADPRDKRLRASALVEYDGLTLLVDCGPDFRQQMLRAGVRHLDAILLTHNHKDHTGGLDDTRSFNLLEARPMNIWCGERTEQSLRREYAYAFAQPRYPGSPEWHLHRIDGDKPFRVMSNEGEERLSWEPGFGYRHSEPRVAPDQVRSVEVVPIQGWHHKKKELPVLGFRFGNIAYLTDMNLIEEPEFEKLRDLDAVTIGCVQRGQHYAHFSLDEALAFLERVGARESYITHISHLLPKHVDFERELPPHVHPAWDGLVIESQG